jgi:hypothetical protein
MTKIYTYNAWVQTFKPIRNTISKYPDLNLINFAAHGHEIEFIKGIESNFVWTEIDRDGGTYIVSGDHWGSNRLHYYVTENPWDEPTEVPTWIYRECACLDESGDYNEDCAECDEGTIDVDCGTVDALRKLYGEDNAEIVQ